VISLKPPHILVFDSGVGGLSIAQDIKQMIPHCQLSYASDNAYLPYGTKNESQLIARVEQVLTTIQQKISADIIVVACNTASTVVLPKIREHFALPVIGVVPAIKPAAELSSNKVIGLLATPGTVKRSYTKSLINDFASHCKIIPIGSSELVLLAEKKLQGEQISLPKLTELMSPFKDTNNAKTPDTIVLACTHFPLLKEELKAVLPHISHWVDSGEAIARRTNFWIEKLNLPKQDTSTTNTNGGLSIFTKKTKETELIKPTLDKLNLSQIQYMEIN